MKFVQRNILLIAGIIGVVVGIILAIPSFLQSRDWLGVIGILLSMAGLILLAISI